MKTVSVRLDDAIYEELCELLESMGQTKQTFYETFTRTAIRERCIPFVVEAPIEVQRMNPSAKMKAFERLEKYRNSMDEDIDYEQERSEAMKEKYGDID